MEKRFFEILFSKDVSFPIAFFNVASHWKLIFYRRKKHFFKYVLLYY